MDLEYSDFFDRKTQKSIKNIVVPEFDYKILDSNTRLLALIGACQAVGGWNSLKGLIKWALTIGTDPRKIYEVLLQGYLFCGYPRAIESFFVFFDIIPPAQFNRFPDNSRRRYENDIKKPGLKTARKIYGGNLELVHTSITKLSPELGEEVIMEGYGKILSRKGLDILTRELAIISALTVLGMPRQLYSHIRGAANVGAEVGQVKSIIRQRRLFASSAKIEKAVKVCEKSLGNTANQG